MKKYISIFTLISVMVFMACTDLEEEIIDKKSGASLLEDASNLPGLIVPAYGNLRNLWWRQNYWGLQELTSDEAMIPTRGTDWYDGGVFVDDKLHTWNANHRDVRDTWNGLSSAIARANYSLIFLDSYEQTSDIKYYIAELHVLRAFYMYCYLDLWGVVPYRDYTETNFTKEPKFYKGQEAFDKIVSDINEFLPQLGNKGEVPWGRINKDVAYAILAKLYLNKEVYTGSADWAKCIENCDKLINGGYKIADNYFDIFCVKNNETQSCKDEAIFVSVMFDTENMGVDNNFDWVHFVLHYNQTLDNGYAPWNGAVLPQSFFEKCDLAKDKRFYDDRIKAITGANLGLLVGQQYDETGAELQTRQKEPLSYTVECPLDGATEAQGVRVLKYEPKVPPINEQRFANDFVIMRISDIYLMRGEAKYRAGQDGLADINAVRTKRGLDALTSLSDQAILDERGFELYWEGHRRQDMIRFGKFTEAYTNKDVTPKEKEHFPIPQAALDVNKSLTQNPGY